MKVVGSLLDRAEEAVRRELEKIRFSNLQTFSDYSGLDS